LKGLAERIYVLIHHCHEKCLQLGRAKKPDDEFSGIGISIQQGIILKILLEEDGLTQKELTRRLSITSSSFGQLVSKLEQEKLVERRQSLEDKRTFAVWLTDAGREIGRQYKEMSVVALEKWACCLTEEEKEQLCQLLSKLSLGLDEQLGKYKGIGQV
jgi:DNA-binding MarR family transcriptional regulator